MAFEQRFQHIHFGQKPSFFCECFQHPIFTLCSPGLLNSSIPLFNQSFQHTSLPFYCSFSDIFTLWASGHEPVIILGPVFPLTVISKCRKWPLRGIYLSIFPPRGWHLQYRSKPVVSRFLRDENHVVRYAILVARYENHSARIIEQKIFGINY